MKISSHVGADAQAQAELAAAKDRQRHALTTEVPLQPGVPAHPRPHPRPVSPALRQRLVLLGRSQRLYWATRCPLSRRPGHRPSSSRRRRRRRRAGGWQRGAGSVQAVRPPGASPVRAARRAVVSARPSAVARARMGAERVERRQRASASRVHRVRVACAVRAEGARRGRRARRARCYSCTGRLTRDCHATVM